MHMLIDFHMYILVVHQYPFLIEKHRMSIVHLATLLSRYTLTFRIPF
jgi:hypothetical protein